MRNIFSAQKAILLLRLLLISERMLLEYINISIFIFYRWSMQHNKKIIYFS